MNSRQKEQVSWKKIIIWIIIIIIAFIGLCFYLAKANPFTGEKDNYCNSEVSCLCKDKCEDIYGHSEWESWLYKSKQKECWCIEEDFTDRIF